MSTEPDSFEARLSCFLSRALAGFQFLNSSDRLSGGASQETYRIEVTTSDGDLRLALRRSAGGVAATHDHGQVGLTTEAHLFQAAERARIPVPHVIAELNAADELGEGFLMKWLDGETLGARIVRADELKEIRPSLARQCGQILARIHNINPATADLAEHLQTFTPTSLIHHTWARYQEFNTPQPMIDYAARWLLANLPPAVAPRVTHGDFRNGNLMVSPQGIIAVLDWELTHLGDPIRDLGWLCTNSWRFGVTEKPVGGFGEMADLLAGYAQESGFKVNPAHVHFWQVFGSFWWAVGCLSMAEHYRNGPDKTVERPAIGRRSSECQVDCVNLLISGATEIVPRPDAISDDLPRSSELLVSVRDFLRNDVMNISQGRTHFLARVASNSLDIIERELALTPILEHREHARLEKLLHRKDTLSALRWRLVRGLRENKIPLDLPGLVEHLRATVVNQALIDQPTYSGCKAALAACKS